MGRSRSRSPLRTDHKYRQSRYSPSFGPNSEDKGKEKDLSPRPKPNYRPSGKLVEERLKRNGVALKYDEPEDAIKPNQKWRIYVFKNDRQMSMIQVSDILIEHESCSKQHAVIQHRQVTIDYGYGSYATSIRPYIIDLESTHGTFVNGKKIEPSRYIQLLPKDIIKFAASTREYVFLFEDQPKG